MSGGDDLESDDEYLDQSWGRNEEVSVSLDESVRREREQEQNATAGLSKKRGLPADVGASGGDGEDGNQKRKKTMNPRRLMIEAGRGIAQEDPSVQAAFLWTCYSNQLKLQGEEVPEEKFTGSYFVERKAEKDDSSKYEESMAKFLKSGVLSSAKKLKKWRHSKSPMVIIISSSARRAVAILKEISALNVRAAKLFAKHMSVEDQIAMLENNKYSIAVGTPNRLLKLFQSGKKDDGASDNDGSSDSDDDDDDEGALTLEHTELVVIDTHENQKRFTVCTMNDTAPVLMKFVKKAVLPQIESRKTIKFAFY